MTLTEYAERKGCSKMTVSTAVKNGRLVKSVQRNARGWPEIVDVELADLEWEQNRDMTTAPQRVARHASPDLDADTLAQSAERQKHWQASLAELKYREAAGELVLARDVESRLVEVFGSCKSKLLGVPSRARQQLPHLSDSDVLVLTALVREALEGLADGK